MGVDVRPATLPGAVDGRIAVEMEADMLRSQQNGPGVAELPTSEPSPAVPASCHPTATSFAEFFEQALPGVYRTALAAAQDRELAHDITAEAFARAFTHWEQLVTHPNPLGWVVRTALNYLASWHRRVRREVDVRPPEEPAPPSRTLLRLDLLSVLRTLPQRQVEVIAMRYLCDMESAEIAEALGITPRTVAVHHHRALHALRAALDDQEDS